MTEGNEVGKKHGSGWWALFPLILVAWLLFVSWLNSGEEVCPQDAHPLMHFAMGHSLHYRLIQQQQIDKAKPEWCAFLWPKGEHWYSSDNFYIAGTPLHPLWRSCGDELAPVIADLLADYDKNQTGDYPFVPSKTLTKCEK